jgi:hypothetical protein
MMEDPFEKYIDWNVHYDQQGGHMAPPQEEAPNGYEEPQDYDIGSGQMEQPSQGNEEQPQGGGQGFNMKDDFMQGIRRLNKGVEDYAVAPMKGFMQGVANVPAGIGNFLKHGVENDPGLKMLQKKSGRETNLPDIPYFDVAPHTRPAEAGEALAFALGARAPTEKIASGLKKGTAAAIDYLQPGNEAERFRATLGQGTSKQNIEELGRRAQFAKGSRKQEALIPKEKLYAQEGKSDVYNMPESSLPEGNLPKVAETVAPGQKYGKSEADALTKAMADYRKGKTSKEYGGDAVDHFLHKVEDIFNVDHLPEKAAAKVEDMMSLPTSRKSKYFSDSSVTDVYGKKGELRDLHDTYQKNPTLNNYDKLQSALKKELRSMEGRAKVSDAAVPKVEQLKSNINNLNADKEAFTKTLPQDMQNLENEFRHKYSSYAKTYEKGTVETGASQTLRRLAEGRTSKVDDAAIVKLFSHPTAADKKAILDMGAGAGRNAIYAAIQKVQPGDAEAMANTILDLKRTKGFDEYILADTEKWAHNMLKQVHRAKYIKGGLATVAGGLGGLPFGPLGSIVGAVAPHSPLLMKYLGKAFKK